MKHSCLTFAPDIGFSFATQGMVIPRSRAGSLSASSPNQVPVITPQATVAADNTKSRRRGPELFRPTSWP
jgi:hypothetical protein